MKKLLFIAIASLFSTVGFADENVESKPINDTYGYFSHGASFPCIYSLNVASRVQRNHNGFEVGVGGSPILFAYEVHAMANYLFFPKPDLDSQIYLGIGGQGGFANTVGDKLKKGSGYFAPGLLIGKSFYRGKDDRRFVQVNVAPGFVYKKGWENVPSLSVSYGYCF